jgi:hypothetical protein
MYSILTIFNIFPLKHLVIDFSLLFRLSCVCVCQFYTETRYGKQVNVANWRFCCICHCCVIVKTKTFHMSYVFVRSKQGNFIKGKIYCTSRVRYSNCQSGYCTSRSVAKLTFISQNILRGLPKWFDWVTSFLTRYKYNLY